MGVLLFNSRSEWKRADLSQILIVTEIVWKYNGFAEICALWTDIFSGHSSAREPNRFQYPDR